MLRSEPVRPSQVVWFDNVTLEPVLAEPAPRTDLVRAELNPTPGPRELTLDQPRASATGELFPVGTRLTIPLRGLLLFAPQQR